MVVSTEAVSAAVTGLHLLNTAAAPHKTMVRFTHPFAQGTYHGEPLRFVGSRAQAAGMEGIQLQSVPFGARWPDGSFRYAAVECPMTLAPSERAHDQKILELGGGEFRPFVWTPAVREVLKPENLQIGLNVGDKMQPIALAKRTVIEEGHLSRCYLYTTRVPGTPMAFEVGIDFLSGLDFARVWIEYSPFQPPLGTYAIPQVQLLVHGAHLEIRDANAKVLDYAIEKDTQVFTLMRATPAWSAGGGQAFEGVLLFPNGDAESMNAERLGPVLAVHDGWMASGAFGAWGNLPPLPQAAIASAAARAKSDFAAHKIGDPWCDPVLGPIPKNDPEDESPDMPWQLLSAEAHGIAIERLLAVKRSVFQRACIPNGFRDEQGYPIPFSKYTGAKPGFPNTIWWEGNVHSSSPYKFGLGSAPNKPSSQGFGPEDDEHDQCGDLFAFALLTSNRWAMRHLATRRAEVQYQVMRTNTGNAVVDNLRAARAEGRMMFVAYSLWLVTGSDNLLSVMKSRLRVCREQWNGKAGMAHQPLKVLSPAASGHRLGNPESNMQTWSWEEGIAAGGLAPAIEDFGTAEDREMLWRVTRSFVLYGTATDPLNVYNAVQWLPNGKAGGAFELSPSGFFVSWMISAMQYAAKEGKVRGDTQVTAKANAYLAKIAATPFSWDKFEYSAGEAGGEPLTPVE